MQRTRSSHDNASASGNGAIVIGGGTFQGYAATAIGGTARITQNIKVRVGAGWSAAGTTVGAGASYQW